VSDENVQLRRRREIDVDGAIWVNEERDAGIWIGHEVARVSEPRIEELLQQHSRP
jgi:hypothetical protein